MIQYDPAPAVFNPTNLGLDRPYRLAILVFDDEIWEDYLLPQSTLLPVVNARGRTLENFRGLEHQGEDILLVYPNTGAPAAAMDLELIIASGVERVVAFGTCGVIVENIPQNTLIIPTAAIREEGTSYHYLPESEEVAQPAAFVQKALVRADALGLMATPGKIWTTDAVYRETPNKIALMRARGCIGVDMELSALLAVAQYRRMDFGAFLIADDILAPGPHPSPLTRSAEQIFNFALSLLR